MKCECGDGEIAVIEDCMIPLKVSTIGVQTMCFRCGAFNRLVANPVYPRMEFYPSQVKLIEDMRNGKIAVMPLMPLGKGILG